MKTSKMKMLRNVLLLLMFSLFSLNTFAQSEPTGDWLVGENNTVVTIEQSTESDGYVGKISSSDDPEVKIGKLMVKELQESKGTWKGKVFSPKRGEWYDAEFTPKEHKLNLELSVGFFSKSIEWKRK